MRILLTAVVFAALFGLTGCNKEGSAEANGNAKKDQAALNLKVYKSPTCGCCGDWVLHVKDQGFTAEVTDMDSLSEIKRQYKIEPKMQSCHTAVSEEGYIFEGHIPAKYISAFLANPPANAIGLTVPGMPVGSPGMEVDDRFDPYKILLIKTDGSVETFASIKTYKDQF